MKKIQLGVFINAADFTSELDDECESNDVGTHYRGGSFTIDWEDKNSWSHERWPNMIEWLLETYGEDIKQYRNFCVEPT